MEYPSRFACFSRYPFWFFAKFQCQMLRKCLLWMVKLVAVVLYIVVDWRPTGNYLIARGIWCCFFICLVAFLLIVLLFIIYFLVSSFLCRRLYYLKIVFLLYVNCFNLCIPFFFFFWVDYGVFRSSLSFMSCRRGMLLYITWDNKQLVETFFWCWKSSWSCWLKVCFSLWLNYWYVV